jgi:hypothetical protein
MRKAGIPWRTDQFVRTGSPAEENRLVALGLLIPQ